MAHALVVSLPLCPLSIDSQNYQQQPTSVCENLRHVAHAAAGVYSQLCWKIFTFLILQQREKFFPKMLTKLFGLRGTRPQNWKSVGMLNTAFCRVVHRCIDTQTSTDFVIHQCYVTCNGVFKQCVVVFFSGFLQTQREGARLSEVSMSVQWHLQHYVENSQCLQGVSLQPVLESRDAARKCVVFICFRSVLLR